MLSQLIKIIGELIAFTVSICNCVLYVACRIAPSCCYFSISFSDGKLKTVKSELCVIYAEALVSCKFELTTGIVSVPEDDALSVKELRKPLHHCIIRRTVLADLLHCIKLSVFKCDCNLYLIPVFSISHTVLTAPCLGNIIIEDLACGSVKVSQLIAQIKVYTLLPCSAVIGYCLCLNLILIACRSRSQYEFKCL